MRNSFIILFLFVEFIIRTPKCSAQELRSGEITCRQISPFSDLHVQAMVVIYTDVTIQARQYLHLYWGDGLEDSIAFINPYPLNCNTNYYNFSYLSHFYSNYGNYLISINEPFYVNDIRNIYNSSIESLKLQKDVKLSQEIGLNSSPDFSYPQDCEWGCCNAFNPIAHDPDGDSLSYEFTPCLVTNYIFPAFSIDSTNGNFFIYPDTIGKYAIAIKINEWRFYGNGVHLIGSTIRQMLLDVNNILTINEENADYQIIIYPNPANNQLQIQSNKRILEKIKINNIIGKEIYSKENTGTSSQLDISFLSNGLYFLIIETKEGRVVKKFVKE